MTSDTVQIRLATLGDLNTIQSCAHRAYAQYVEAMGQTPAPMHADYANLIQLGHIHIAETSESVAGYVVFYRVRNHLQLENVAVFPELTGQGIGRLLIEYAEQYARDHTLDAVELYTNEAMAENLLMYPKLGYVETDRKRQDGYRRVFFRKVV